MTAIRAALLALALVACAWFAIGARQAHDLDSATAIVSGQTPLPAGQAGEAAALFAPPGRSTPISR